MACRSAIDRPDVVVCYDDKTALFLMDELRAAGVNVPDDVGVVGFRRHPVRRGSPTLGSPRVSQRSDDLGRVGVDFLLSTLEHGKLPVSQSDAGLARRSRNHTGPSSADAKKKGSRS